MTDETKKALVAAREALIEWGQYVPDWAKDKHDFAGDLAAIDAALSLADQPIRITPEMVNAGAITDWAERHSSSGDRVAAIFRAMAAQAGIKVEG